MEKYNHKKIEKKWQKEWLAEKIYEPNLKNCKKPFYNLMMFPYPSAEGLHIGNMYAFVGSDIYGRFKKMKGNDVFEPIGLDGFGIHSENYALKIKTHPMRQAQKSEKNYYRQLRAIGNGYAWNEHLETYDPKYYKLTQWIFLQLFKSGLAYRKKSSVNWCPFCKTVLADEQVVSEKCERCGNSVIKRELEQWFLRITKYAHKLLKDLDKIDWSEKVKIAQRNWIGESEGAIIKFSVLNYQFSIDIFTTRPDTLFGCTYLTLSPEYEFMQNLKGKIENWSEVLKYIKEAKKKPDLQRTDLAKEKTGVELAGIKAINPINNEEMPIWVSDYVLSGYGTGAIMAVPAHDERDFEFAKKFNLPIKMVICPNYPQPICPVLEEAYAGEGHLVASGKFTGMESEKAKTEIVKFLGSKTEKNYKLRDWLISRQRYWGAPIPLVFCENCAVKIKNQKSKIKNDKRFNKGELENPGWIAVPENALPIKLPFIKNFRPTGTDKSPLANVKNFYEIKCPKCKNKARRETDVSDTFLDSAWYYFRYIDVLNKKEIFNKNLTKKWLPVNMYIGGAEHSVLHLLYSRFITKVLNDLKLINFSEPFTKFRAHGLIIKDGAKMSKSRGNVVNPDKYIKLFGADGLRMYLMFLGPFDQGGDFRDEGIRGISRFLNRVWMLIFNFQFSIFNKNSKFKNLNTKQIQNSKISNSKLEKILHQSIKKITEDIENLRYNTAISQLMILLNSFHENKDTTPREYCGIFLKLLSPFAPHIAEELWARLGNKKSIHLSKWPKYNPRKTKEEIVKIVVQINGKIRDMFDAQTGTSEKEAKETALNREKVKCYTADKTIKKIIFVPDKLINLVV